MILIIESGATKSDWLLIDDDGSQISRTTVAGMNLTTMSSDALGGIISDAASVIAGPNCNTATCVTRVYLYAAGIPDDALRRGARELFGCFFPSMAVFEIESDLLAAARAVCGRERGVAAILGTGSNSCLYDGNSICAHINTGGFILGDEGSAARLGLRFLSDHIKGLVPREIDDSFNSLYDGSYAGIVANVYGRGEASSPSAYLGSFAPFLLERYDHPYVKGIVDGNFEDFFERCIARYRTIDADAASADCPLGIAGGFGYACRDILRGIASSKGMPISRFVKSPIEGLSSFHCGQL